MSKKRVIYFGGVDRKHTIDYLYQNHQWEPVSFIDNRDEPPWVKANYPNSIVLHSMEIRMSKFDYSKLGKPVPIDAEIIGKLSRFELNFLGVLEDSSGWNYSFFQRRDQYYDTLKYWNTIIHHLEPDLVIFFNWPHTASCYSLYLMCKYSSFVKLLFLDVAPLLNGKYNVIGNALEELYTPFVDLYESKESLKLSSYASEYFTKLRSKRGLPFQALLNFTQATKNEQVVFRWKAFIRSIISTILSGSGFKKAQVAWKKNRRPFYKKESKMNNFEYFLFREILSNKNKRLLKYYNPLCVELNIKKKYLYFASTYQPEAVAGINAGVYDDLFLALDILSSVIPKDWIIYYKENPVFFSRSRSLQGSLRRDKYYFQRVAAYENIQLVSASTDTFQLIDNAQAVATVSGTVAWEAVVRGKPALSFGNAWYMGCRSIFRIKTLQDAQDAIEKIENGFKPEQKDIERYAAVIENVAVKDLLVDDGGPGSFDRKVKASKNIKYEMERIAKAMYEAYERHYAKEIEIYEMSVDRNL